MTGHVVDVAEVAVGVAEAVPGGGFPWWFPILWFTCQGMSTVDERSAVVDEGSPAPAPTTSVTTSSARLRRSPPIFG
jgi:hypothetical protein